MEGYLYQLLYTFIEWEMFTCALKAHIKNINIVFWTGPSRPKSSPARTVGEDSLDMLLGRGRAPRQPHL
jgi:hypothetical protein